MAKKAGNTIGERKLLKQCCQVGKSKGSSMQMQQLPTKSLVSGRKYTDAGIVGWVGGMGGGFRSFLLMLQFVSLMYKIKVIESKGKLGTEV